MCANLGAPPPPRECITFRTIRRALREMRCSITPGCHCSFCHYADMPHRRADNVRECQQVGAVGPWSNPHVRLAYVVGQLRARDNPDCDKAADYLLELFTGQHADRRDDEA